MAVCKAVLPLMTYARVLWVCSGGRSSRLFGVLQIEVTSPRSLAQALQIAKRPDPKGVGHWVDRLEQTLERLWLGDEPCASWPDMTGMSSMAAQP